MLFGRLKDLVYPPRCILCRRFLERGELDLCGNCRADSEYYPYGASHPSAQEKKRLCFLDSFTAVWYYEGDIRKSIHRYKFQGKAHMAAGYGRLLGMKLLQEGPFAVDCLTWVPVSRLRRWRRGYDQCERLAEAVGKELGIRPVSLLKKVRNNPPQSSLPDAMERKANVSGVYRVNPGADVSGKTILLLDDVFTTGATTEECARILLSAGAAHVHCAVIAAAPKKENRKPNR